MLVKRVVLDVMYARGAAEADLAALCSRGFALSISLGVLQEWWARSVLDEKPGLLFARAKRLNKYLDPVQPLTPVGLLLSHVLTPRNRLAYAD